MATVGATGTLTGSEVGTGTLPNNEDGVKKEEGHIGLRKVEDGKSPAKSAPGSSPQKK